MEYVGETLGYQVFRNKEGYLEGYHGTGKLKAEYEQIPNKSNLDRVVTLTKTMDDFGKFILGMKKEKSYAPSNVVQPTVFAADVMEKLKVEKIKK